MGFLECYIFLSIKLLAVFNVNIAIKQRKCKMAHVKWGLLVCLFKSLVQGKIVCAISKVMDGIT